MRSVGSPLGSLLLDALIKVGGMLLVNLAPFVKPSFCFVRQETMKETRRHFAHSVINDHGRLGHSPSSRLTRNTSRTVFRAGSPHYVISSSSGLESISFSSSTAPSPSLALLRRAYLSWIHPLSSVNPFNPPPVRLYRIPLAL